MDDLANIMNRMIMRQSLPAADVIYSNIQRDRSCDLCLLLWSILQTYSLGIQLRKTLADVKAACSVCYFYKTTAKYN